MALHIASEHVDRLAEEIAGLTGESVETAVERALEARLAQLREAGRAERIEALRERLARFRAESLAYGTVPMTKAEYDELWSN